MLKFIQMVFNLYSIKHPCCIAASPIRSRLSKVLEGHVDAQTLGLRWDRPCRSHGLIEQKEASPDGKPVLVGGWGRHPSEKD